MLSVHRPQTALRRAALGTDHVDDARGHHETRGPLTAHGIDGLLHALGQLVAVQLAGVLLAVGSGHMAHHGHQLLLDGRDE